MSNMLCATASPAMLMRLHAKPGETSSRPALLELRQITAVWSQGERDCERAMVSKAAGRQVPLGGRRSQGSSRKLMGVDAEGQGLRVEQAVTYDEKGVRDATGRARHHRSGGASADAEGFPGSAQHTLPFVLMQVLQIWKLYGGEVSTARLGERIAEEGREYTYAVLRRFGQVRQAFIAGRNHEAAKY